MPTETHSGLSTPSYLLPIREYRRAASTVTPLLPKATLTQSIQPYLILPLTRPPLTSAINTLLAIRYASILSTCPTHLNTLRSALLAYSIFIPAQLRTSSFVTLQPKFSSTSSQEHSLSFSEHFSYPMSLLRTTPLVQLLLHMDTFWSLSPITPSIQPNLILPRTRPPLTSAINTLKSSSRVWLLRNAGF